MQVAMLGAGTMGAGMARSAAREGHDVAVWNRTAARAEALAGERITAAGSVTDAVTGADVVVTMLYDADSVLGVTDELRAALGTDAVWLQSATVGVEGIERIAGAAAGAPLLDAPMLGTRKPAEEGNLVPLVSGPGALLDRVRPVLDAIGARTVVVGDDIGQASALKLACNAWIASITAAAAQSVVLAQKLGLDGQLFLDAIGGGPVDSPYAQLKGGAMLAQDWTPSFELDGGRKDLGLIIAAAGASGVDTGVLDAVLGAYDRASEAGHGDDDLAAVYHGF